MTTRHIFTTHRRLFVLTAVLIAIFFILYALRGAVWPYILGVIIAYILLPAIKWMERRLPGRRAGAKRLFLVVLSFILFFGILGGLGFYLVSAIAGPFIELLNNAPTVIPQAIDQLQSSTQSIRAHLTPQVQQQVDQAIQQLGTSFGDLIKNMFLGAFAAIPSTFGFFAGLAALPFFLFYMLKDWEQLGERLYAQLPPGATIHARNIAGIFERVIGRYVRGNLVIALTIGIMDLIGLLILQVPFAAGLALFAGITELVPIIGPWLGGAAGVITVLATDVTKTPYVLIVYFAAQFLENNVLVPRIHGGFLEMHPALAIFLITVGAYLAGFWGLLIAVPLGALVIKLYQYIMQIAMAEDKNVLP